MAAFNYAAFWFSTGKINHSGLREAKARALFELDELKRANTVKQGKVAAKTLTKAYGADQDVMDKLFLACATRQDRNPAFQNQKSDLMRRAAAL